MLSSKELAALNTLALKTSMDRPACAVFLGHQPAVLSSLERKDLCRSIGSPLKGVVKKLFYITDAGRQALAEQPNERTAQQTRWGLPGD